VEVIELGTGITSHSLRAVSNKSSMPQIFIGGGYIGGTDELEQHFMFFFFITIMRQNSG
jgi:glutaredoxin